jgi:hypothetical protein
MPKIRQGVAPRCFVTDRSAITPVLEGDLNVEKCKLFAKPIRRRPDRSKFPLCECGGKFFAMLDADESTGFYLAACQSCGEEYVFGLLNGVLKVVNLDEIPDHRRP